LIGARTDVVFLCANGVEHPLPLTIVEELVGGQDVAFHIGIDAALTEISVFQMMQFIPLVIIPQVFFSGIIPLDSMADWVKDISYIIPLKYSGDAVNDIIMRGTSIFDLGFDIMILLIFLIVLTILNVVGLKRYRKV